MNESASQAKLVESAILARAAILSRERKLKQAEVLLLPLVRKAQSHTATLDLLAKVYAQQGRIEEARALWLRALDKEPSNRHFLRAVSRCENLQRLGHRRFFLSRIIGLKIFVAAGVAGSAIVCLSREAYLTARELGVAGIETLYVLIGKEEW